MRASCNLSSNNELEPLYVRHGIKPKFYDLGPQIERNPKEPPKGKETNPEYDKWNRNNINGKWAGTTLIDQLISAPLLVFHKTELEKNNHFISI